MLEIFFSLKKKIQKNIKGTEKIKKIADNSYLTKKSKIKDKTKKIRNGHF